MLRAPLVGKSVRCDARRESTYRLAHDRLPAGA